MFVALWVSPGIVTLLCLIVNWYRGKDITAGDLKLLFVMSTFGIFIPMLEKEIALMPPGKVVIAGRKASDG